jgi:hypothetical protein
MARVPKVSTGTYDGRPFVLIQHVVHIEGSEYIRRVEGYLLEFENDDIKYVLDYDPLLKFDPIELKYLMPDA